MEVASRGSRAKMRAEEGGKLKRLSAGMIEWKPSPYGISQMKLLG